jgi:hypothetical protein
LAERIERPGDRVEFLDEALKLAHSGSGFRLPEAPVPAKSAPVSSAVVTDRCVAPDEAERARRALSKVVGPIANVLVQRALNKVRSSDELWELLASDIGNIADRSAFLAARHRG